MSVFRPNGRPYLGMRVYTRMPVCVDTDSFVYFLQRFFFFLPRTWWTIEWVYISFCVCTTTQQVDSIMHVSLKVEGMLPLMIVDTLIDLQRGIYLFWVWGVFFSYSCLLQLDQIQWFLLLFKKEEVFSCFWTQKCQKKGSLFLIVIVLFSLPLHLLVFTPQLAVC